MTGVAGAPGTGSRTTLSRRICLAYGIGSVGTGVVSVVPGLLLLFYLTNLLGVPAGVAGLVLLLPKLWDVLLNPVVGSLSDRAVARGGGRGPFLLAGAVVTALGFATLFVTPRLGSTGLVAAWVGVVFLLAMSGFALFQVPYVALPSELTAEPEERTRLVAYRMVALTVGILVGGAVAPLVADGIGGRGGYAVMSVLIAVVVGAAMLACWRGLRTTLARTGGEHVPAPAPAPASVATPASRHDKRSSSIKYLVENESFRPFLVLLGGYLLQSLAVGCMLAASPYYATYVLGRPKATTILFAALVAPAAVVVPLWRRAARRLGKLGALLAAIGLFGVAGLALLATGGRPLPVYGLVLLLGCGYAGMQLLPYSMLADVASAGDAGPGRAGAFTGVWQAVETAGLAVGPAILSGVLAATGFVSGEGGAAVAQSAGAVRGVRLGFALIPAVLLLASVPLLARYRVPSSPRPDQEVSLAADQ